MAQHVSIQDVQILQPGTTVVISSSTAFSTSPLPLNGNGDAPRVVRVVASHLVHLKFGAVGMTTCSQQDLLVAPAYEQFYNVRGARMFSSVIDTGLPTNSVSILNIMPVEI